MSYFKGEYPEMPSFGMSLKIVTMGALTGWLTYTDWYEIRRDLREIGSALYSLLGWFIAWLALLVCFLFAPVAIVGFMIVVRRNQRRVMIANRKRYLRDRLRVAVKGYSWG